MKKGGLTARISVAIWGVPLILGVTFFGGIPLIGLIFVLIILGQIEYYKLQLKIGQKPLITIGICCGIVVYAAWFISLFTVLTALIGSFLLIAIVGTLRNRTHVDIATTFTGIMYLPVLIGIFPVIRAARFPGIDEVVDGRWIAICIWAAIWIGDTAAYGIGKCAGKTPLAKRISPKKTVEGFIAGVIGAVLAGMAFWLLDLIQLEFALVVGVTAGFIGQLGDLVESKVKREADVKDSSNFLPGHGGIFDRFDSLAATTPTVAIYLALRGFIQV